MSTQKPVVILVTPQMGENIGAAARAMANCDLDELRLVQPRDGWPNEKAWPASSGATDILDRASVFATTEDAVADLNYVVATTARPRDLVKPIFLPEQAIATIRQKIAGGSKAGILFGAERMGLLNEDIGLADGLITVPLNPDFTSLNLAQAVLLVGYEWYKNSLSSIGGKAEPEQEQATKADLINLFEHLEEELGRADFFKNPKMRPVMVANMRAMLQRAALTGQEVRTFHGMIVALTGRVRNRYKPLPPEKADGSNGPNPVPSLADGTIGTTKKRDKL